MANVIEVEGLVHRFGPRVALEGITFAIGRGEVFGLLGPNGAGKTTTVRLLNGLYKPEAGRMRVAGFDPQTQGQEVRNRCGVLTETPALYERLSAYQNLRFFAVLSGMPDHEISPRVMELLEYFDLEQRAGDRVGTFSKGMKQRLALARALLNRPEILFLDEPTSGLDPEASQQVHELIAEISRQEGRTVFLCTHNLYEAERLCDRVGVMERGRLKAVGTLEELRRAMRPDFEVEIEMLSTLPAEGLAELARLSGVSGVISTEKGILAKMDRRETTAALVGKLVGAGAAIMRVEPRQASLEEIYFSLQNDGKDGVK